MAARRPGSPSRRSTHAVSESLFQEVYDSPAALPGKERWVTSEKDVRAIEKRLGLEPGAIGVPLWVSGDTRNCPRCGRETSWLDIVESGLAKAHDPTVLIRVILGDRKFVNTEAPSAIADLVCSKCKSPILDLRSFKCHNWAYARGVLADAVQRAAAKRAASG